MPPAACAEASWAALCSDIELTGGAMEVIGDYYAELRAQADTNALPITVRTLETIIRLSTAAAKARLSTGSPSCHLQPPAAQARLGSNLDRSIMYPEHLWRGYTHCQVLLLQLLASSYADSEKPMRTAGAIDNPP